MVDNTDKPVAGNGVRRKGQMASLVSTMLNDMQNVSSTNGRHTRIIIKEFERFIGDDIDESATIDVLSLMSSYGYDPFKIGSKGYGLTSTEKTFLNVLGLYSMCGDKVPHVDDGKSIGYVLAETETNAIAGVSDMSDKANKLREALMSHDDLAGLENSLVGIISQIGTLSLHPSLDYSVLLNDLMSFSKGKMIRAKWTRDYCRRKYEVMNARQTGESED